ncbi:MAG: exosortase/archaeosortase family protein [Candidatus Sulfotelmatobacter sp.]
MPSTSHRRSNFESLTLPVFFILAAISLAIWWSPITSSFALALHDEQYTHILMILPISAALIFMDWKPPEPFERLSVVVGSVLLAAAASGIFFMKWGAVALFPDERLAANMLALVIWWIAAFILCFGLRATRRALFPLCFLFGLVPFPDFVLNPVVKLLQQGSAAAAHLLFAAAGVPVQQRGLLLHIPGLTVEVARECSSIRSSSMLIVTTMVLAQLLLRSPWRKALIILVAIPLSVAKNGLRIFTIAMLTTRVDPGFLTGRLHREGGIIFFLIALVVTFLLLWILRRAEEANHSITAKRAG